VPARLRALKAVLAKEGIDLETPSSGSHWKFKAPGRGTFPVPAGNGLHSELADKYIRSLCRTYGLDFKYVMKCIRGEAD